MPTNELVMCDYCRCAMPEGDVRIQTQLGLFCSDDCATAAGESMTTQEAWEPEMTAEEEEYMQSMWYEQLH